jgi:hypothetical protein
MGETSTRENVRAFLAGLGQILGRSVCKPDPEAPISPISAAAEIAKVPPPLH